MVEKQTLIPRSNYFYPNRIGRLYLKSLEEVLGESGLNALLNLVGLSQFIVELPPDDLERSFDFAFMASISQALDDSYGPRGGRRLALQSGRIVFQHGLRIFGPLVGATDLAFRVLPLSTKVRIGLPLLSRIFTQFSDQVTRVESYATYHLYYIDRCPVCWGRTADEAVCHVATGVLQEALHWVSGGEEFLVEETACIAAGAESCVFRITREPLPPLS